MPSTSWAAGWLRWVSDSFDRDVSAFCGRQSLDVMKAPGGRDIARNHLLRILVDSYSRA